MNEFDIIEKYFQRPTDRADVRLSSGDDCAITSVPEGCELATSMDTLIAGVHFHEDTDPYYLGHKVLAVNLSDLAAMGAQPCWVTMAMTLPNMYHDWVDQFCQGFFSLLNNYQMALIGGDLTKGPLSITCNIYGTLPKGKAMLRSGAEAGDGIYVSGMLGDAGYALDNPDCDQEVALQLVQPQPRIATGLMIRDIASACIDISDGLTSDLSHILKQSKAGAVIRCHDLPLSNTLQQIPESLAWQYALSSGDDYELCFTVPPENQSALESIPREVDITRIGVIDDSMELKCVNAEGKREAIEPKGYKHF